MAQTRWSGPDVAQRIGFPDSAVTDKKNPKEGRVGMDNVLLTIKNFDSATLNTFHDKSIFIDTTINGVDS